ncbi:ABC transporter ATP-binding protein [Alkalibacillus salilacus]|uniref:ABC transporter ATP-binding protein n=1 Tax=Alkalibacillus salilacus TaxID=284582 RepID=UPI0027D8C0FF|nr:ABC transporter ATP-binding protein [Alkalibacillus salilacus]
MKRLFKSYKGRQILNDIHISIDEPQIIALVGPNGSGKTTLLDCMTGLVRPDQGSIELLGKDPSDPTLYYDVSYLQDNRVLYEDLTGYEHLYFICRMQKQPLSQVQQVIDKLDIATYMDKKVKNYSLGMKQHLLLAIAIINNPKLLILDEPLNGMDPSNSINVRNLLLDLYENGTTIILSSHNLDEIDRLTNDIFFLKDGELLKESIEDLAAEYYFISVQDMSKAKEALNSFHHQTMTFEQDSIQVKSNDVDLHSVLQRLVEFEVNILDIKKRKTGAKIRYQELYGGVSLP